MFVALVLVLLAQPKDFFQHLHIEAFAFSLGENLLLALIQRLYLFVDVLDALDKRANAIAAIPTVSVMCRLSLMRTYGMAEKVTERLRGQW